VDAWVRVVVVAVAIVVVAWAVLAVLAARLPPGRARELAAVVPDAVTALRVLGRDPRVPRRAKAAVVLAALWCLSPIDLVPEFLPVIGLADDVVVLVLALRYAARRVPPEVMAEAWPGEPATLARLLGTPVPPPSAP
jgi:uncharacterized membrane protein YkvA (DUF1232 family)